ncbi:MAG: glutaredoxin family protein [Deltaproteobacteria bacterium]|nr:glutaredoxin family protein [Deltaproteobacteria bacterium]
MHTQRGLQRGFFLIVCAFFALLAFSASDLSAEERRVFFKYTDDAGQLHIVQSIDRVPVQYRNQIGEIALEGDPQWIKSAARMPASQSLEEYVPAKRGVSLRNSDVVLYYADWCGFCKKAKRWLDERNVRYDLRDIDVSPYGDELAEVSGGKSVPVLMIGGEVVRGFNPSAYERALGG